MKMRVTDYPTDVVNSLEWFNAGADRSREIHVSDLVRVLAVEFGYLDEAREIDETARLKMWIGCAVEDRLGPYVAKAVEGFDYHPGPITTHGIVGNVDGIERKPRRNREPRIIVHEMKATWFSSANKKNEARWGFPWYWIAQLKLYCYMWRTTQGVIHPFWINGDYKPPTPIYGPPKLIRFRRSELQRHWDLCMEAVPDVKREIRKGTKKG